MVLAPGGGADRTLEQVNILFSRLVGVLSYLLVSRMLLRAFMIGSYFLLTLMDSLKLEGDIRVL